MARCRLALALLIVGPLTLAGAAEARPAPMAVRATAACTARTVYVRLADGSIRRVTHVVPGRTVRRIGRRTPALLIAVRIRSGWSRVQAWPGQELDLTASGPRGERWSWLFLLRSRNPLDDPTDYIACLSLRSAGGRAFVRHLRTVPGSWTFAAQVRRGSLRGSRGQTGIAVR